MKNIFENAKFGDRFRTRGSVVYPIIFLSKKDDVYRFMDVNEYVLEYKAPNKTPIGYPRRNDLEVVGKWEESIDEEKLADLELDAAEKRRTWAIGHYKELGIPMPSSFSLSDIDEAYMGGYDAGYRKAKEE